MLIQTGNEYKLTGQVFDTLGNCYEVSKLPCIFHGLEYEVILPENTDMIFKTVEYAQGIPKNVYLLISFQQDCVVEKSS
jgi:hypothetical protein